MIKIYALSDPMTGEIRYIGKTKLEDVRHRRNQHVTKSKSKRTHRDRWIFSLIEKDERPQIAVIQEVAPEYADDAERYWIAYFRSLGAPLTNHTDGGEGGATNRHWLGKRRSAATRAKISKALSGRKVGPVPEERKEKISKAVSERWNDPEFRKRHREGVKRNWKERHAKQA